MENYQPQDIPLNILRAIHLPRLVFAVSLAAGSLLLLAFLLTRDPGLIGVGIGYIVIASFVNTGVLAGMVACAFRHRKHLADILWHTPILLLNIPIAYVYTMIVVNVFRP